MSSLFRMLFLVIFFSINCIGTATTYYVKNDGDDASSGTSWQTAFITISHSLEVSESGDEIWIKEGIYQEGKTINIPDGISLYGGFAGTETELSQREIPDNPTIIDGENSYQCIMNNGYLDSFLIVNGFGFQGGGVSNVGGIIQNCSIYNNTSWSTGGGVWNDNAISSCTIYNNSAMGGGGIYNYRYGTVNNCTVYGNNAEGGGGIFNESGTIQNSFIHGNSIEDTGGGEWNRAGGIWNEGGIILNCLIYNNTGRNCGGVFNRSMPSEGYVINCTIYSNSSDICGGISNGGGVLNCIIWNNEPCDAMDGTMTPYGLIHYSCFGEGNPDYHMNIRADPQFVNTSGDPSTWDFHLKNGSACIDRGTDNSYLWPEELAPERDLEGRERPGNDNKICMGAYESPDYYEPSILSVPIKRFYVSKNGNNTDGSSWENAFTSITLSLSHVSSGELYEIWIKEGIYNEKTTLDIPGKVNLIGGFAGNESILEERLPLEHPTIIDGDDIRRCIDNHGYLDGLFVTRGYAEKGGGIYNSGTVQNCIIYNNHALSPGNSYGGGIYNYRLGVVTNSKIFNNHSGNYGGGVYNWGIIRNCLIYANEASSGGGIRNELFAHVNNCIVYGNSAVGGGGIYYGSSSNTISWNNTGGNITNFNPSYSCFPESTGSNHCINSDPLFINTQGDISTWDFHLQEGSPCIDAGNPEETYYDGCLPPGMNTLRNDMGAYGGPNNCGWGYYVGRQDIIDHLIGMRILTSSYFSYADRNKDGMIDIGDLINMILVNPDPPPTPTPTPYPTPTP